MDKKEFFLICLIAMAIITVAMLGIIIWENYWIMKFLRGVEIYKCLQ